MVQFTFTSAAVLALISAVLASPQPITPDAAGAANVGKGTGQQFITGACLSTADCRQPACCAGIVGDTTTGICSGLAVGDVAGKSGCGFGDNGAGAGAGAGVGAGNGAGNGAAVGAGAGAGAGNGNGAAAGTGTCAINAGAAGSQNVGKGNQAQFITGQCLNRADCASDCCSAGASGAGECRAKAVVEGAGGSCAFQCSA